MENGKKELLLDQLSACHNDKSWFVPLSIALDGLTVEQAVWRDHEEMNTIWQIVNHLVFWNDVWLGRFKVGTLLPISGYTNNETTFDVLEVSEEAWESALTRLDEVMNEWRSVIASCSESKLDESVSTSTGEVVQWWMFISNLCTHMAYHIGQIVLLRQRQGCWVTQPW